MKSDKLIEKALLNLGYKSETIKTKSDLMLSIANWSKHIEDCKENIAETEITLNDSIEHLALLKEFENEYEKEILRKLNPKRTIY